MCVCVFVFVCVGVYVCINIYSIRAYPRALPAVYVCGCVCVRVRVCVCGGRGGRACGHVRVRAVRNIFWSLQTYAYVCIICIYVCTYMSMYVCNVCAHDNLCAYCGSNDVLPFVSVFVCVYVCVCVRERESPNMGQCTRRFVRVPRL
jgi:hypothetical protein